MGYQYMESNHSIEEVRTIIYSTLIFSNVFLTLSNRSFYYSVLKTLSYKNRLIPLILGVSILILILSIYYPPIQTIFGFVPLQIKVLSYCLFAAFIGVMWIEIYKFIKRRAANNVNRD